MKKFCLFLVFLPFFLQAQVNQTRYEASNGLESGTYWENISWWKELARTYDIIQMTEMGESDAGLPIHLIVVSTKREFDPAAWKKRGDVVLLVNNGIHPGEPEGIDATMLLVRDIAEGKSMLPPNLVLAVIPVYNVGGALNRSENYRIDQNGPVEKGFRGNAQNLDLNRDFIKADSRNAFAFTRIFHHLDPDVFIDNHASNGADYQHVMTLLTSQHNKLGGKMGRFMNEQFDPGLRKAMKQRGYDLIPYVNHYGGSPEKGWKEFWDSPRYSSGYATLWSTFAFVPETHMLKSYRERVDATRAMMESFIEFTSAHQRTIVRLRKETREAELTAKDFPLGWKHVPERFQTITFKGFESGHKTSNVSGLPRLYYDRSKPYQKEIAFYNYYTDTARVTKPAAYLIPRGWWKVIDRLRANGVDMKPLPADTTIEVEVYRIENYVSLPRPFESHHLNQKVAVSKSTQKMHFRAGDLYIPLHQKANRFLVETLEPRGEDSYFAWNFFDGILGQKEGYSDYHFEEVAAAYLRDNPSVRKMLEEKKSQDPVFAGSARAQLDFVFEHSPYLEPDFNRYPVYRVPQP